MNILEIGIEKGKAASILELLEETGKVSEQLRQKILDQHDSEILSKWLKLAAKAETIEEFERRIIKTDRYANNLADSLLIP